MIECHLHVLPYIGVGIFINAEAGGCVLNEDMHQPNSHRRQKVQFLDNFRCNQVASSNEGWKLNCFLGPMHGVSSA